ncbi:CASP-like protein 3A1 [Cinnamomum micranthum f. kanehirae]|uniref:CASP-like protein n=1 Tax=Cinnamomum micranthum f. kanehirae TaxID=337451 RepID=A0A3S3NP57_9MAGN|nr:CASP-like protein 3A1 [Cinnamomum micranthum f. kanehirae]
MSEGRKKPLEIGIQMPETKTPVQSTPTSGPLVPVSGERNQKLRRKADATHALLRLVCLLSSVAALSVMITAEQSATISLYGFELPLYSKWTLSDSLEFLVGMSAAVAAHSLLQLVLSTAKLLKKSPVINSRKHAWIIFAGDQVLAYAMMSAGSASAGVTNLNRTGIRHSALPDFCKPLHRFCDRATVSVTFAFLSCFMLASSAVLDVLWLSMY